MDLQNNRNISGFMFFQKFITFYILLMAKLFMHIHKRCCVNGSSQYNPNGKNWNYDFDAQAHSTLLLVVASVKSIIRYASQSYHTTTTEMKWCCKAPPVTFNIHKIWIISLHRTERASVITLCKLYLCKVTDFK